MLQLYKNIKARRLELNMTQSELASKMGYADKSVISKIESGKIDITQSKIIAFAHALQTDPGALMGCVSHPDANDISDHAADLFALLDEIDQARIIERMEAYLEADKYKKAGENAAM